MSAREAEFLALYRERRFEDQRRWYAARHEEYREAHDQIITTTGVALFGASAAGLAAASGLGFRVGWAVIASVMAALGTLIDAYGQLLGFEQNAKVYGDARAAIAEAHQRAPWLDGNDASRVSTEAFVDEVESVLQRELGQWGQLVPPATDTTPPTSG